MKLEFFFCTPISHLLIKYLGESQGTIKTYSLQNEPQLFLVDLVHPAQMRENVWNNVDEIVLLLRHPLEKVETHIADFVIFIDEAGRHFRYVTVCPDHISQDQVRQREERLLADFDEGIFQHSVKSGTPRFDDVRETGQQVGTMDQYGALDFRIRSLLQDGEE
jgi:hypothetical protein